MEDWEVTGDILKQRWRDGHARAASRETIVIEAHEWNKAIMAAHQGDHTKLAEYSRKNIVFEMPEFNKAIMAYLSGDHTKLAEYLCAHPISRAKQAEIAWALEERARIDKPGPGRRPSWKQMNKKMNLEALASWAELFYRGWRDLNKERGLSDWGHREKMKYQACELVVELDGHICPDADAEAVMAQLKRPKSRRNSA
jgi:hypothetical protein